MSMMTARPPRVAVIGAGWAGLACAVHLAAAGIPPTVFEAARQTGGRARTVMLEGLALDNGQHLLIGAYDATLQLMNLTGARPEHLITRTPLRLPYPGHFNLKLPALPAPLHLAIGLLCAKGVPLHEKFRAALFMQTLKRNNYQLRQDVTVSQWLDASGQQGVLRRFLWEPLCLAALNTPPAQASAQIFANVLRDSLGGNRQATDLLLPRAPLSELLPAPATNFITRHGGEVRRSSRIDAIKLAGNQWQLQGKTCSESFDQVIIAVAPQHAASLLATRQAHAPLLAQLATLDYEPIGSAYLAYPPQIRLPAPLIGLAGPYGQWVIDRGMIESQAGIMAFSLSGNGPWDTLQDEDLAKHLHQELRACLGTHLPAPRWHRIIRERRATFSCRPNLLRPTAGETAEPGLWLAGDYTWAEYPATLEGAVRSGIHVAEMIRQRTFTPVA